MTFKKRLEKICKLHHKIFVNYYKITSHNAINIFYLADSLAAIQNLIYNCISITLRVIVI